MHLLPRSSGRFLQSVRPDSSASIPRVALATRKLLRCPKNDRCHVLLRSSAAVNTPQLRDPATLLVLQNTEQIDRVRYQTKAVFCHFDRDGDGKLSYDEVQAFLSFAFEKVGQYITDKDAVEQLQSSLTAKVQRASGEPYASFADVVQYTRKLIDLSSNSYEFASTVLSIPILSSCLQKSCLTRPELSAALCIFNLLDTDNDGRVRIEELVRAGGIEQQIAEGVLDDADEDEDGLLSFPEFLKSYAKERPVALSAFIMIAHTATMWILFNAPLDMMLKTVIAAAVVLKPQIITNPVVKVFNILKAIYDRIRAEIALSKPGR